MPEKWVGIYPAADDKKAAMSNLLDKHAQTFALVAVSFQMVPKEVPVTGMGTEKRKRLRYQLHSDAPCNNPKRVNVANLLDPGDTLKVVWFSHAVCTDDEGMKSVKYSPHYNTSGVYGHLSAKELARCIYRVCQVNTGNANSAIYPTELYIFSCAAGAPRALTFNGAYLSHLGSSKPTPLAFRTAEHLKAMYAPKPAHTCAVYATKGLMLVLGLATAKLPPEIDEGSSLVMKYI